MSALKSYQVVKDVEDLLGEVVDLWETEGKSDLPLTRRVRGALDRIEAWKDGALEEGLRVVSDTDGEFKNVPDVGYPATIRASRLVQKAREQHQMVACKEGK